MKKKITVNNLVEANWDSANNTYCLRFSFTNPDGMILLVTIDNVKADGEVDEFYWDNAENVNRAIEMADADDIRIF